MQDALTTLPIGMLIRERYLVKGLVGKGNFGAVYLIEDQNVKRVRQNMFALKEITGLSQQERYQFTFDSIPLKQIHHQALPRIYRVFNDDKRSRVCIVMDYVKGPNLETLVQHQPDQRFTWSEVAQVMTPIVDAVSCLHRQETPIVHDDIKPANILFAQLEGRFMLVDLGVAREYYPDFSVLAMCNYKAPEQGSKAVDVYGLGATCYTLLTGVTPTSAHVRITHFEQEQADPLIPANTVVPTVPLHVSRAIHRAMSIRADERFSSVEEFWQTLQTPSKELTSTVDKRILPATTSTSIVIEKTKVLADVQIPLVSKRPGNNITPFSFLKRHSVSLFLLILLLGGASAGIWSFVQSHHATSAATKRAGITFHALTTSIATPTSSPGNYPSMFGSYTGTLVDISTKVSSPLILQEVQQIGGTIHGYLTVGSPLNISGSYSGTIDFSKHFHFTLTDSAEHLVLFIEGAIQTVTSLSGDFYRCSAAPTQGEKCSRASDDYGIWSALLVAPSH